MDIPGGNHGVWHRALVKFDRNRNLDKNRGISRRISPTKDWLALLHIRVTISHNQIAGKKGRRRRRIRGIPWNSSNRMEFLLSSSSYKYIADNVLMKKRTYWEHVQLLRRCYKSRRPRRFVGQGNDLPCWLRLLSFYIGPKAKSQKQKKIKKKKKSLNKV